MRIDEIHSRRGPPVAEQSRLHVLDAERLAQERVGLQIDLPDRQVVRRAPPSIDEVEVLSRFGHRTFQAWRAPRGATLPKHRQRPARFFRLSTRKLPTIKCVCSPACDLSC